MDETVNQRCGSCKIDKPAIDFSPSYWGKPGTWCKACFAAYNRGEDTWVNHEPLSCTQCGEQYIPKQSKVTAKFCSRACKDKARTARWAVENAAKKPVARSCVSCGGDIPQSKRSDAVYCTDECGERTRATLRYNKTRGAETVERFTLDEVYERDAGVCYLCHEPCSRAQASMEHVVPIGAPHFGQHTRANVRLADLACNARKGNYLLSELSWYVPMT